MRRLALALALAAAFPTGVSAFTIQGAILKGEAPVAGQVAQLHVVRGEEELKGSTATTGADGRYQFAGLDKDPAISYYVSIEYENAFYTEGPLTAGQGETVSQDFTVYEVGRDISAVQVKNHHIIIERKPDGFHVTEILIFENKGRTAYLGTGPDHAENAGARVGLPASIQGFQQGIGGDAQTTHLKGRELSSERPIPPGVRPFSFSYRIPLSGRVDLSHRLYFPTASFVVLVDDPKLKIDSRALQFGGVRDQGGKQYAVYSGSTFGVGQEIQARIGGAGFWSNPGVYPWVAAPFPIVAALWFAARRGRRAREATRAAAAPPAERQPATVSTLPLKRPRGAPSTDADFRKAYLMLIAALDEGLERGEFSRETHTLIRQNLKRRLQALLAEEPASGVR
ncbi:MAG TPA: carboxypeptidase-like regulatory domain-containing protein [Candidatus Binatia bacterium]|nr:carboxypeptidase-like regulatory domain-containing protein [Candidatus Binatia bacterium]